MAKGKTHVADTAGIDIVGLDDKLTAMIEQAVENIDCLAGIGVHGDNVESAILVGREPIEFGPRDWGRNER